MFDKYRAKKNRFLPVLNTIMDGQEFGRLKAECGLKELCMLLGDKVDLVVSVSVKNMENYIFSTLPEDEARFYLWHPEGADLGRTVRTEGMKVLEFGLDMQGVLSGIVVFEMSEQADEEEISEYKDMVPMMRAFLYCCFLAEAYYDGQSRDCVTHLPCDRVFEKDLCTAAGGYFLAIRINAGRTAAEGLNADIAGAAEKCASICPGSVYRIGPDVLAVLYCGGKAGAVAAAQEVLYAIPDSMVLLEPLTGADAENIYRKVRKWSNMCRDGLSFPRCEGLYPKLPLFEEEAL